MGDEPEDNNSLDLGLTDLLSEESVCEPPKQESDFEQLLAREEEKALEAPPTLGILWEQGEYREIVEKTEQTLAEAPKECEARLWWIRAQCALGELPKQVLCSSLEDALSPESFDNVSVTLAEDVSLELAEALQKAGETSLAISALDRCRTASPSSKISAMLLSYITHELDELPRRKTLHTPAEMKKRLYLLELRRGLEEERRKDPTAVAFESTEPQAEVLPNLMPRRIDGIDSRRFLLVGGVLIIAVALLWMLMQRGPSSNQQLAGSTVTEADAQQLAQPELARIDEVSQLTALMYDVEKSEASQQAAPGTAALSPQARVEVPTIPQPSSRPKAKIDTAGPVETERIRELVEGGRSDYDDPPLPRFPRDDRNLSRAPIMPREEPTPNRRDDPYRAQTWSGGQRYEVVINTSVMANPSFNAEEVSELFVGDRILVDARIGRWLKLRSAKGRSGYILASDAQKLYD